MNDKRSDKVFIFAGRATQDLARRVAEIYGIPLGNSTVFQYADGEFQPSYEDTIRGGIVFIIQSTIPPTDNLFELLMMIDAAKRASAQKIIAVIPYYGFARQDRKDKPHVPIASRLIADMITTAGVDRVITMDLHADQSQGFFTRPVDQLYGNKPNEIGEMRLIGDVEGKHVILLDDIIDTGSTICKAAGIIKQSGAKSVRAMITHPVLSGNAIEKVEASDLEELVVSDTIPLKRPSDKIHVLSCDWLLAEAIRRVVNYESLDNLYETTLHHKGVIKRMNE